MFFPRKCVWILHKLVGIGLCWIVIHCILLNIQSEHGSEVKVMVKSRRSLLELQDKLRSQDDNLAILMTHERRTFRSSLLSQGYDPEDSHILNQNTLYRLKARIFDNLQGDEEITIQKLLLLKSLLKRVKELNDGEESPQRNELMIKLVSIIRRSLGSDLDIGQVDHSEQRQQQKYGKTITNNEAFHKLTYKEFVTPEESCPGYKKDFVCNNATRFNVSYTVSTDVDLFEDLKHKFPDIGPGGSWRPRDCDNNETIALIIPYKDREVHLKLFVKNIIPFLQAQRKAFAIFVVEQIGDEIFNKAAMMNAGFLESQSLGNFTCFIFHDVDLIPVNLCNNYGCQKDAVRHLGVSKYSNPHIVHSRIIGAASAFTNDLFRRINGFSNLFFGWGGEDDDGYWRLRRERIKILRYHPYIGNYHQLKHRKFGKHFPHVNRRFPLIKQALYRKYDGLNTVNYKIHNITTEPLFTKIVTSVQGPLAYRDIVPLYIKQINDIRQKLNLTMWHRKNSEEQFQL